MSLEMPENSSNTITFSPTLEPPLKLCTHEPCSSDPAGPAIPSPAPPPCAVRQTTARDAKRCLLMVEDRAGVKNGYFKTTLALRQSKIQGCVCGLATELKHSWSQDHGPMGDYPNV